jgi:hypothetical protein
MLVDETQEKLQEGVSAENLGINVRLGVLRDRSVMATLETWQALNRQDLVQQVSMNTALMTSAYHKITGMETMCCGRCQPFV